MTSYWDTSRTGDTACLYNKHQAIQRVNNTAIQLMWVQWESIKFAAEFAHNHVLLFKSTDDYCNTKQ